MPFTGKKYEDIVRERKKILQKAKLYNLELVEQFLNTEEKKKFENHSYGPLFIAEKDHQLINLADLLIADYNGHSIGRDCEIVMAKEVFNKRVISIVQDLHMQNHPWIRLYSDYIVKDQDEAFQLANNLSKFNLASKVSELTREQKDQIDIDFANGLSNPKELLPTELRRRWKVLFGKEYKEILEYSFTSLPKTIRVNTLKIDVNKFLNIAKKYSWKLKPLKFCSYAFRLENEGDIDLWNTPEYKDGLFYIQELASLLSPLALNPQENEKVLDIAAAPGSKTTQMAQLMKNTGEILANDISPDRMDILKDAVKRLGIKNIKFYLGDGKELLEKTKNKFDKVLVDGPCSNDGIFRYKNHKFLEWNLLLIYYLRTKQKELLEVGFNALKPGGTLVYSTCSFNPEENEAIVSHLLSKYANADIVPIEFKGIKFRKGLTRWEHFDFDDRVSNTIRIYPKDNNSIGFYLAKIKKGNS